MKTNSQGKKKQVLFFSESKLVDIPVCSFLLVQSISSIRGCLFCIGHFPEDLQSCSCHLVLAHLEVPFLTQHMNLEEAEASFALTEMGGIMIYRFLLIATEFIFTPLAFCNKMSVKTKHKDAQLK